MNAPLPPLTHTHHPNSQVETFVDKKASTGELFDKMRELEQDSLFTADAARELEAVVLRSLAPAVRDSALTTIQ